jgi:hypothetical protein
VEWPTLLRSEGQGRQANHRGAVMKPASIKPRRCAIYTRVARAASIINSAKSLQVPCWFLSVSPGNCVPRDIRCLYENPSAAWSRAAGLRAARVDAAANVALMSVASNDSIWMQFWHSR